MPSIPYESVRGNSDQALAEIGKILAKFGCQSFGHMIDAERGVTIVQFKFRGQNVSLEASWKGYAAAYKKAHPREKDSRALELGKRAVCSCLRDWIKGQVTAVECGVMSFGAVFMPHMLLPTGERVIDRVTGPNGLLRLGGES